MEVHHHSHTPRKRWKHYFWEFLMLFFAVFCGFLAENLREKQVEHHREKQFMISMIEDLQNDTSELLVAIRKSDSVAWYSDSVLWFLYNNAPVKEVPMRFAAMVSTGGMRMDLINTDRTSSQLKNSGAMRLIRNKKVSDSILLYWKRIEESKISLDRYMTYRDAARVINFKLWVIPQVYYGGASMARDSVKTLRVINTDTKLWDEFANLQGISGAIAKRHTENLKRQFETAVKLIALIKKQYHTK